MIIKSTLKVVYFGSARLLPSMTCQKCKEKNTTLLELKQELAEERNKLKDAMKKIEELQNVNKKKKTDFLFKKFYTGLCKIMEYLCGFIIESIKRQRNCSISGRFIFYQ